MTDIPQNNPWLAFHKQNPLANLRLFCFPFAGGSAMSYRTWAGLLPTNVEVCPIELPGRGSRIGESLYTNIKPLVTDLAEALMPYQDKPYVFFGHSMGALIGFEIARFFNNENLPGPVHLFVSGHAAPQFGCTHDPIYDLPEPQFIEELRKLDGTPEAVLNNSELMQLIMPMLRADFEVNETYIYEPGSQVNCQISVYGGVNDKDVSQEKLEAWREQTLGDFSIQMFAGGHFFLQTEQPVVLQVISHELKKIVAKLLSMNEK
jgi:medium-chain acyl-[acyl-carrier-protein] hydrolase